jgi:sortase A
MRMAAVRWLATRRGRRAAASALTGLATAMVFGAAALAGYPYYTDWRASGHQKTLRVEFGDKAIASSYRTGVFAEGSPLTRLIIPRINLDTIVVEGTSEKALAAGAGHYPSTPLPGNLGNVAIAGHRTMNGKPFGNLDLLQPGDKIELVTPFARYFYVMIPSFGGHANPWATDPTDLSVAAPSLDPLLTLTTCHPRGTARQRLVARARLERKENIA